MPPFSYWCGQQDSNLHAHAMEPKSTESTNSTMPAYSVIFFCKKMFRDRKSLNPPRLPVAVPEIFLSLFARKISTAATRSAHFLRHRRRSHRFPIPSYPHVQTFYHGQNHLSIADRRNVGLMQLLCIRKVCDLARFALDIPHQGL